jgi:hypothetical protein
MTPFDLDRAKALTKIFSAQELDYITEILLASKDSTDNRVDAIIWEAFEQAALASDDILPE